MKVCTKCGEAKPDCDFPLNYKKDGETEARCKACKTAAVRDWRARNKDRTRAADRARYLQNPKKWQRHISSTYGISAEDYDRRLKSQGGVCAICSWRPNGERLAVDHNHFTGVVRGLLCGECNRMLGQARDNPSILVAGARYLEATNDNQEPRRAAA